MQSAARAEIDTSAAEDNLGSLAAAVAEDMQRLAGAAEDSINAAFAIQMLDARRSTPRHALAGTLKALQEARSAALIAVSRNTATDIRGRQQSIIAARSRRPCTRSHETDASSAPAPVPA
jgi:hypothetical protein